MAPLVLMEQLSMGFLNITVLKTLEFPMKAGMAESLFLIDGAALKC